MRTIPAWNTWVTPVSFFTTALLLGGLAAGVALAIDASTPPGPLRPLLRWVALGVVVLLGLELVISLLWVAALATEHGAASRAATRITREHGLIFRLRLALTVLAMAVAGASLLPWGEGAARLITLIGLSDVDRQMLHILGDGMHKIAVGPEIPMVLRKGWYSDLAF